METVKTHYLCKDSIKKFKLNETGLVNKSEKWHFLGFRPLSSLVKGYWTQKNIIVVSSKQSRMAIPISFMIQWKTRSKSTFELDLVPKMLDFQIRSTIYPLKNISYLKTGNIFFSIFQKSNYPEFNVSNWLKSGTLRELRE